MLVSLGASDPAGVTTLALCGIAAARPDLAVDVVVGANDPNRSALEALAMELTAEVRIYAAVTNMASLMAQADLVIGAAGVSSWERCCLGLPSIVIVTASNQVNIAEQLDRAGAILLLENRETLDADIIAQAVTALAEDGRGRARMSCCATAICDGLGVRRVVERLDA